MRSPRPHRRPWLEAFGVVACAALGLALSPAAVHAESAAAAGQTFPHRASQEQAAMWMSFGPHRFDLTLEDNATARAFAGLAPLTLDMPDLNRNEKHVTLPRPLPTAPMRPGTIRAGDVMLYGTDVLVVFYETFESSYSYTRIGRLADGAALARALGPGSQRITFTPR